MDNYETGIYTDNPDDTLRYMKTTVPVFDHWGYEKKQDDYVQVVRYRDCSHTNARSKDGEYWHCVVFNLWMGKDFFCKDGERRSE